VDELRRLYLDERLSLSAIAARLDCSLTTVWRRLKAAGIGSRPSGGAFRYPRHDFSGDVCEKAYLIGFRIGDLHVALLRTHTILVKCTSTRPEQIELFRRLFEAYGHVYTDEATMHERRRQTIGMEARLNRSFDFLLPKQDAVPDWVLEHDDTFFAFLAGYMDAEGYIRTYLPPGYQTPQVRIEVRSADVNLLRQLACGLGARGIVCPPVQRRTPAGYLNRAGIRSNREIWGLAVYRKEALLDLFARIDPFLRHRRRRRDMLQAYLVLSNNSSK
jgi:hypothetical protein